MGKKVFYNAVLVMPDRLLENGWVLIDGGRIIRIGTGKPETDCEAIDCEGKYLSPGFIDVHCHGGGGASFQSTKLEDHVTAMRTHPSHGVTSMTPTPGTADPELITAYREIKKEIDHM